MTKRLSDISDNGFISKKINENENIKEKKNPATIWIFWIKFSIRYYNWPGCKIKGQLLIPNQSKMMMVIMQNKNTFSNISAIKIST